MSDGAADLLAISKHLKAAGEGELRKEFHKGLQAAAKPLIPEVRAAARADLPKRGGLNERIARKPFRVQVRTGATTAGVRIIGTKVDPRINEGKVYHPVFGRRPGVVQQVPGAVGYFDKTLESAGPQVQAEVTQVMRDWTSRILRSRI